MNPIIKAVKAYSKRAREKRASIFRGSFFLNEETKILDLGSETGSNIHALLQGTCVKPQNVYIADINAALIEKGRDTFGFVPVLISEDGRIPFDKDYFDIVYCSSVIEHVTVSKEQIWSMSDEKLFKHESLMHQREFAREIQRVGKQYFVQTPYKHFPIESHSWLPFIAWLPRKLLIPLLSFTNSFWVKQTRPDWYLLNSAEMTGLFEDAKILTEKSLGLTKSMMAVKSSRL